MGKILDMLSTKKIGLFIIIMILTSPLILSGCSTTDNVSSTSTENRISIDLSIDYPDSSTNTDIQGTKFSVGKGIPADEMLELYCKLNNMPLYMETTNASVIAINGVQNSSDGSWKSLINGKEYKDKLDEVKLSDGDKVEFIYKLTNTTNDNKEEQ